jgi:stage V sporulation protein G
MKITDVAVQLAPVGQDRLRGFCCVTIDGCFVVRDIKIINGPNGLFVAMPSRKIMAPCPQCRTKNHLHAKFCNTCGAQLPNMIPQGERVKMHCDVAHPINAECRQMVEREILAAFNNELSKSQQPGYMPRQLGDGGDTFAPSEVASHNP